MQERPAWGRAKSALGVHQLVAYCIERDTLLRSIKTALVVGTILAFINHGQQLLSGQFSPSWIVPMLLTYLVPFCVATYGQVQGKRQRDRALEPQARALKTIDERETNSIPVSPFPPERPGRSSVRVDRPVQSAPSSIARIETMPARASPKLKRKIHLVPEMPLGAD